MSHGNPCFAYLSFSTNITLYIFLFDQVAVLNEVQTLDKLVRYTVPNLHIGSTGWRLGPQNWAGQGVLYFNTVIGLSHLCFPNLLYFLNNSSVVFLTQLHSISEYWRILDTPHHLRLYWNWWNTLPSSSSREVGELGETSLVE